MVSGYSWLDSHTLQMMFEPQNTSGKYRMILGPEILDVRGNALDQDGDGIPGEMQDDQYIAAFELSNAIYWSKDITTDTIWNYSMVVVNGSFNIASGSTLTIKPGTVVKFSDRLSGINVKGYLKVPGMPEHPVIMTSWRDDTAGGDTNVDGTATTPAPGDWAGLTLEVQLLLAYLKTSRLDMQIWDLRSCRWFQH